MSDLTHRGGSTETKQNSFGIHQALEDNLADTRNIIAARFGFDFEHQDRIFGAVEPEVLAFLDDTEFHTFDLRWSSPRGHIPESLGSPDTGNSPTFRKEKILHEFDDVLQSSGLTCETASTHGRSNFGVFLSVRLARLGDGSQRGLDFGESDVNKILTAKLLFDDRGVKLI